MPQATAEPLTSMIEALDLEVAAIKKSGGRTTVEISGGTQVGQSGGNHLYSFPYAEDLRLRDDTPITVQFDQQEANGTVVSFGDGVLVLALEEDLGQRIPRARLVADDSFLIERLRDRLHQVASGEAHLNRLSALRAIGQEPIEAAFGTVEAGVLDGSPVVNEEQRRAISHSLGSNTTFVWGPPGTGKTTALARIVEAHYRAGRSILIVSNTNIAVDTALEKIGERLKGDPDFQSGAILRFGPVVKEELRRKFGKQVILDDVVARLSEGLLHQLSECRMEAERVSRAADRLAKMIEAHEAVAKIERERDGERHALSQSHDRIRTLETNAARLGASLTEKQSDFTRAEQMGGLRRWWSGLSPERLQREIRKLEIQRKSTLDAAEALRAKQEIHTERIERIEAQLWAGRAQVQPFPSLEECQTELEPLEARIKRLESQISELQEQLKQIREEVVKRCRVLATTVYRTYLKGQVERQFDVVVIDEASMLMLPMSFYAAGLATVCATFAGDFRQLPPIVLSNEEAATVWLKTDVFHKVDIPARIAENSRPDFLVALRTQYRMREDICALINELFYPDHPLLTDISVHRQESQFPLSGSALSYVDTAALHPWAALKLGTFSRYNLLHAMLTKKIVGHLAERGFLPRDGAANEQLGAVAPFSAQVRLTQALLNDSLGAAAQGIVATVHRFQGNEKTAMLVDLTDSTGSRLSKFMKGVNIDDDGSRLLNVALSRARQNIVLLGNFSFLRQKAPPDGTVNRLLDVFETRGERLDLESILSIGDDDWIDGLRNVVTPTIKLGAEQSGAFNEGTFYPAFSQDLQSASKSILLFSPFLTQRGAGRWVDHFRAALERGVAIRIVTRPSSEFGGAADAETQAAIEHLKSIGVCVDLRARMHEKIAIIDERLLWMGSLNILSHRDTSESMFRISGEVACNRLVHILSMPKGHTKERKGLFEPENPVCPDCGKATTLCTGRYGVWFECSAGCGGKVDPRRSQPKQASRNQRASAPRPRRDAKDTKRSCPKEGCSGTLVRRTGRYGPFLGCSRYPQCRYTENV
jgi:chaperonin cofactor prefoldin